MIEQFVKSSSLSCLLNENRTLELIPEPFRMQGNVSFRVTFQEYTTYILSLSRNSNIMLSARIEYLKGLASSKNPKLYSYFLKDMAFAIIKEVWFAELYNKEASVILPANFDTKPCNATDLLEYYVYCSDAERLLLNVVYERGFEFKLPKENHNMILYQVAVFLYHMSINSNTTKELNIVYEPVQ